MNKRVIFASILLTIGLLFTLPGANLTSNAMSSSPQQHTGSGMRQIVFSLQDPTQVPPLPLPTVIIPTIVINPTPGPGGVGFGQFGILTMLVFVLVGAIILIALIAILRRA